jgi:hypothetical protein
MTTLTATLTHPRYGAIAVQILDANSRTGFAQVRALTGEPFATWTHGGGAHTSTARVPFAWLSDIQRGGVPVVRLAVAEQVTV